MERNKNLNDLVPFRATHPGFVIEEELDYMGVKKKDFAEMIGIRPTHLSELLKGKRTLSADVALRIEQNTELKADTLLKLQAQYNIDVKRIAQKKEESASSNSKNSGKSIVHLHLPTETYNKISIVAKEQGTTINAFIRSVIDKAVVM